MTKRHRLIEALRLPVHGRLPIRRSTVVIAIALIVLAVLYGSIEPSASSKALNSSGITLCSADGKCSKYVQAPTSPTTKAPKTPSTTSPSSTTTPTTTVPSTTTSPSTTTPTVHPSTTVPGTTLPRSGTTTTTVPGRFTSTTTTSTTTTSTTTSIP